jgi:hypothetical protein
LQNVHRRIKFAVCEIRECNSGGKRGRVPRAFPVLAR